MEKKSQILSQGTYGCIYRPGISCKGEVDQNNDYITKIQKEKGTSAKEAELGKKIQTIPSYAEYFAPIIDTCPIQLVSIKTDAIDKCDFIKKLENPHNPNTYFESNRIKYVGKDTLADKLVEQFEKRPATFLETFMESYVTLLEGIQLLNENGIIHFDLKENNIMCRDKGGRPIIIDFGLSIDKSTINDEQTISYFSSFFVYSPDYEVWCIDIAFLTYMTNELNAEWFKQKIIKEQIDTILTYFPENKEIRDSITIYIGTAWNQVIDRLFDNKELWNKEVLRVIFQLYGYEWKKQLITEKQVDLVINNFFDTNPVVKYSETALIEMGEKKEFKERTKAYFSQFIGKPWNDLLVELLKYQDTWDNYSLAVIYLILIRDIKLSNYQTIVEFQTFLKSIVYVLPNERITSKESKEVVLTRFSIIPKKQLMEFRKVLKQLADNAEHKIDIKRAVVTSQLAMLKREH